MPNVVLVFGLPIIYWCLLNLCYSGILACSFSEYLVWLWGYWWSYNFGGDPFYFFKEKNSSINIFMFGRIQRSHFFLSIFFKVLDWWHSSIFSLLVCSAFLSLPSLAFVGSKCLEIYLPPLGHLIWQCTVFIVVAYIPFY